MRGHDGDQLTIRVKSRLPKSNEWWDGNWLQTDVSIRAGGFGGTIRADLRIDELDRFCTESRALYESLRGEARLEPIEDQLKLTLRGDGIGHIALEGTARDKEWSGNLLTFEILLDQTLLFGTVAQLDELLTRFPLVGNPPSEVGPSA